MAENAKLQELKQQLAKLDSGIDELQAKRILLKDQVTFEEFQTVWNGLRVRNAASITERIATFEKGDTQKLTAFAAFQEVFADQVSDYEFREVFFAERVYKPKVRDQKSEVSKGANSPDL